MDNGNLSIKKFFSKNQFIGSFKDIKKIPDYKNIYEYCFIGRSNVGKSSIINSITNNKNLAKTSKTPGRTQSINVFSISEKINLIDLPGYGYSKVSKVISIQLKNLINNYIEYRENLQHIFVLVDTKIDIKNTDIDMFDFISGFQKKFSIVFTKIDKCSNSHLLLQKKSVNSLMNNYQNNFSNIFCTSAKKNTGIFDIQKEIYQLSHL